MAGFGHNFHSDLFFGIQRASKKEAFLVASDDDDDDNNNNNVFLFPKGITYIETTST